MRFRRYREGIPFTRRQLTPVWLILGTVVVLLLCGCTGVFLYAVGAGPGGGGNGNGASAPAVASGGPNPSATAVVPDASHPAASVPAGGLPTVPGLIGVRLSDAKARIKAAGFVAPRVEDVTGADRTVILDSNWVVRVQEPAGGTRAGAKTRILLKVGKPTDYAASAPAVTGVVPNVLCKDLQSAQDTLQAAGFPLLSSLDGTGKGRHQIIDRNWVVVGQSWAPGTRPGRTTRITLTVVKFGERNDRCPT